jgi:hypothetical protein
MGRFISEDPIRFAAGVNFYAYVLNSPVLLVDPFGFCPAGTHVATPTEVARLLSAAKDIVSEGLSYKDIKCNQFVARSINRTFDGALSQEYNTYQIRSGQGPFEKADSPAAGGLAVLKRPGHAVLVTQVRDGRVSQFVGSQTSTGPAYVNLPDFYWKGRFAEHGNAQYYKTCLPN